MTCGSFFINLYQTAKDMGLSNRKQYAIRNMSMTERRTLPKTTSIIVFNQVLQKFVLILLQYNNFLIFRPNVAPDRCKFAQITADRKCTSSFRGFSSNCCGRFRFSMRSNPLSFFLSFTQHMLTVIYVYTAEAFYTLSSFNNFFSLWLYG